MSRGVPADLLVMGVGHRAATPALRARLFVEEPDYSRYLEDLRRAGLSQGIVVATCERVEVAVLPGDAAAGDRALRELLAQWTESDMETLAPLLSVSHGQAALRHLFAVAAGLDSQVLGEPNVLGQVRQAHRASVTAGLIGQELEAVLQQTYVVAKRVRSETALAEHPVSIAAAAAKVARQVHGDLRRTRALLLGLGEMGELMAAQLRDAGVIDVVVTHPVDRRAEAMARRIGAHARAWTELEAALAEADIVVACLGDGRYAVTAAAMSRVLKRRRQRPIFVMDTAVPSDIEPAVEELDPAFVYDLGDLERVAQEGRARREAAALAAWRIVDEELDAFQRRRSQRETAPALTALSEHLEAVRAEVLANGKLDAEAATRQLIGRLLHEPSEALRAAADDDDAARLELEYSLKRLFGLGMRENGGDGNSEGGPRR